MASSFPNLPGYVPTQDLNIRFRRISARKLEKVRSSDTNENQVYELPDEYIAQAPIMEDPVQESYLTTTNSSYRPFIKASSNILFQPNYSKADRHVLRFFGTFKESVPESNLESARIRRLIIYLYLVDNTISINEEKQLNSGIPQGSFLKRQNINHAQDQSRFINAWDFKVGQFIEIHGKNIRLFDCDEYTRKFYQKNGKPQPPAQFPEVDAFRTNVLPKFDIKDWYGLNSSVLNGQVPSQKQFLANDRKVLKFYVHSEYPYIMHYYLADDTMEIREVKSPNSGRGNFSVLLKRQKFPAKFKLNLPGHRVETGDYIKDSDIQIFERKFQVLGCDQFTQDHYKRTYGMHFPLGDGSNEKAAYQREFQIPPYNYFGDEEDSLGNCFRLVPKPPKKDYFKWVDNQIQLRFNAVMNTDKPEDVDRKFIITYYLNDDTLMVYEPQQRNSGIVSGKFLEKMKYKNMKEGARFFLPEDFRKGSSVLINSFSFRILGCDQRTETWYQSNLTGGFDGAAQQT